jgi:hypothetical protein
LELFYQGNDLPAAPAGSGLAAVDIFGLLPRVFRSPNCQLVDGIDVPPDWKLDRRVLIAITRSNSFLFSVRLFDCVFSCKFVPGFVCVFAAAIEHFSHSPGRQWQLMAIFVVEIGFKGVVSDTKTIDD